MCASLAATGACGRNGGDANNNADSATTATASGDVARDTTAGATASAAAATPSSASGTTSMSITGGDPEIIQVLATVDQGEIADGQMAQRMARNAQVKALARTLVTEHTASLQKDRQLAKTANVQLMNATGGMSGASGTSKTGTGDSASKAGVNPGSQGTSGTSGGSMSNVAMQLQTMHQQTSERLSSMQGAAFDSAFVNAQVMGHQQVLTLLQGAASQGQNSAVSQHLADATKHVQDHLERAQKLQQSLASGTSDSTSKGRSASDTSRKGS